MVVSVSVSMSVTMSISVNVNIYHLNLFSTPFSFCWMKPLWSVQRGLRWAENSANGWVVASDHGAGGIFC
jgi:hypothetical protein